MIKYKGYTGTVEVDFEDGVLFGHVCDLRDIITFQGDTVQEVEQAFRDSVDDYLEFCQQLGKKPEKPFSGHFTVRIDSELHQLITLEAARRGISLNQWVGESFRESLEGTEELRNEHTKRRLTKLLKEREEQILNEEREEQILNDKKGKQKAKRKTTSTPDAEPKAARSVRKKADKKP